MSVYASKIEIPHDKNVHFLTRSEFCISMLEMAFFSNNHSPSTEKSGSPGFSQFLRTFSILVGKLVLKPSTPA